MSWPVLRSSRASAVQLTLALDLDHFLLVAGQVVRRDSLCMVSAPRYPIGLYYYGGAEPAEF